MHAPAYITRSDIPWTSHYVFARLTQALGTARHLPGQVGPSRRSTWWPDTLDTAEEAYGYTDETPGRPQVSRRDVARMEEAEAWISRWLSVEACRRARLVEDTGWLVACRALGWSYARIGKARKQLWTPARLRDARCLRPPGGNSRPSLTAIEQHGLVHLATQLNRAGITVDHDTLSPAGG